MITATWKGTIIASSDRTVIVEGNHYFPPEDVSTGLLKGSDTHSTCPWKGLASYKSIQVGDAELKDGCWYYPAPKAEAANIRGYYAFWKGVQIGER